MTVTPLKQSIRTGEVVLGTIISEIRNPAIARMLASAGLDFFIIDMEHGTYNWETMQGLALMGRACGLAPIVRIPEIRRETILKPLDAGAAGLLVPVVNNVEQAMDAVMYAKYPPRGQRGTALGRSHCDYRTVNVGDYLLEANENTIVIIQIESVEAVERIDALMSIDGIDGIFVGPMDLSVSYGRPGQVQDSHLQEAVRTVIEAGKRHRVPTGIQLFDLDLAMELMRQGMQIMSYSSDIHMIMNQTVKAVKDLHANRVTSE